MRFLVVLLLCAFAVLVKSDKCKTPNNEEGNCISLNSCPVLAIVQEDASVEKFIKESVCGSSTFSPKVCCGSLSNFTSSKPKESVVDPIIAKQKLLPSRRHCGLQHSDEYFRVGNDTSIRINEFPWLALINYKAEGTWVRAESFTCSGSLINTRYVLTAAFCLTRPGLFAVGVRLGEYHIQNNTDCVKEPYDVEECNDVKDFGIDRTIVHSYYNDETDVNNVGLIRLNKTVKYSDYIRPICLPLPGTKLAKPGDLLHSSGFGLTENYRSTEYKKKIVSKLITNEECAPHLVDNNFLLESFMCSFRLRNNTEFECGADQGGPLMASNNKLQWHQEGIIVPSRLCSLTFPFPDFYVRVESYVKWILEHLES